MEKPLEENLDAWKTIRLIFLSLDYKALLVILSSDKLKTANQCTIWQMIHDWVDFERDTRLTYLARLIQQIIQFDCLSKQFVEEDIFKSLIFNLLPVSFQASLKNLTKNVSFKETNGDLTEPSALTEPSSQKAAFSNFSSAKQILICISCYTGLAEYYHNSSWQPAPSTVSFSLPTGELCSELALLGGDRHELYAFGGSDRVNQKVVANLWSRDLKAAGEQCSSPSGVWTARSPMSQARKSFSSVVLDDCLYVFGGYFKDEHSNTITLNSCERYDSQTDQWSALPSLRTARRGAAAALLDGCIYLAGGLNRGGTAERSVEVLHGGQHRRKWDQRWQQTVAPMSYPRSHFALVVYDGRLWAVGGFDGKARLASVESYDLATNSWQEEAPLGWPRSWHAAVVFQGELLVVGGVRFKRNETTQVVERYSPDERRWLKSGSLFGDHPRARLIVLPAAFCTAFYNLDF